MCTPTSTLRAVAFTAAFALTSLISCAANAQNWRFQVDRAAGGLTSDLDLSAPIPGSVIGDYDAVANPTGTQTRPGLFGGSGNNVINFDITLETAGKSTLHPGASFILELDAKTQSASLSGFTADLINGSPLAQALTLQLLYDSFHTVNPTAIFPGGVVIPLPLGEISITALTVDQTGESLGAMVETGLGEFELNIAATADATVEASVLGQTFSFGPLPLPIVIAGTLTINGGTAALTLEPSITFDQTVPGPFPGAAIEDLALDVPTVLPPGSTAHLLFSGELESLTLAFGLSGSLTAPGTRLGDVDVNGVVNIDDLLDVIGQWGPCAGACPADLDGNGVVDNADIQEVTDNWG